METRIAELYETAAANAVSLVTFPELSLTGYTVGDLVQQTALLEQVEVGRQTLPNGPKVGTVSLDPRGDWRMPADLHNAALWSRK